MMFEMGQYPIPEKGMCPECKSPDRVLYYCAGCCSKNICSTCLTKHTEKVLEYEKKFGRKF